MITKVVIGKSFKGCVGYVLSKPGAEILDFEGVRIESTKSITKDFTTIRNLRPQISNAVWHTSVSFAYEDKVDSDLMRKIARDYLEAMGLSSNQFLVVRHIDAKHQHFHIVSNRIGFDGKVITDQWSKNRSARVSDLLEEKYGLIVAQSLKRNQGNLVGKASIRKQLKEEIRIKITKHLVNSRSVEDLIEALKSDNIEMQLQVQSTGRINGVSFKSKEIAVKGSSIHKDFSFKHIMEKIESNNRINLKNERRIKI